MTATTTVTGPGRSGSEIRAALAEHAPAELAAFEQDFYSALSDAAASFDTRPLEQLLTRWWRVAAARSIQLTEAEQNQIRRAHTGDYSGLYEQASDGTFRRLG